MNGCKIFMKQISTENIVNAVPPTISIFRQLLVYIRCKIICCGYKQPDINV